MTEGLYDHSVTDSTPIALVAEVVDEMKAHDDEIHPMPGVGLDRCSGLMDLLDSSLIEDSIELQEIDRIGVCVASVSVSDVKAS
jgi:hypothetical protein